jgi:hypothetical protein
VRLRSIPWKGFEVLSSHICGAVFETRHSRVKWWNLDHEVAGEEVSAVRSDAPVEFQLEASGAGWAAAGRLPFTLSRTESPGRRHGGRMVGFPSEGT